MYMSPLLDRWQGLPSCGCLCGPSLGWQLPNFKFCKLFWWCMLVPLGTLCRESLHHRIRIASLFKVCRPLSWDFAQLNAHNKVSIASVYWLFSSSRTVKSMRVLSQKRSFRHAFFKSMMWNIITRRQTMCSFLGWWGNKAFFECLKITYDINCALDDQHC